MSQVQVAKVSAPRRLAESYLMLVSNMASAAVGGGVAILLGFNPIPSSFPVVGFAREHPQLLLGVGGVLLVTLAIAITITQRVGLGQWLHTGVPVRALRFLSSSLLSAVGSAVIGVVLGFSALPSSIPLLGLLRLHPPVGIGFLVILLGLLILAPLLGPGDSGSTSPASPGPGPRTRLLLATAVSTVSALLFISLLVTVIVRPSWCPNEICPAPVLVTNPLGVHDAHLEVFPAALQSATFAMPNAPATYLDFGHLK